MRNALIFLVLYAALWAGMAALGIDSQTQTLGLVTFVMGWIAGLIAMGSYR